MDSWCCKLFTSIIILPFTAGNYRTRRNGSRYYDCAISFRVLFLCCLAVVAVFSATKDVHAGADARLGVVLLILSLLITGGIVVCLVLVCLAQTRGLHSLVTARSPTSTSRLQVGFLWIFGLGASLFAAFLMAKMVECSLHVIGDLYWNTIICFNAALIVCFLSELIFITYFSTFKLKHSTFVNYSILTVLASNICMQLYVSIIGDSFETFIKINHDLDSSECLSNNSTLSAMIQKSRSMLAPMFTEFVLLSSTVIVEIWSPSSNRSNNEHIHSDMNNFDESERTGLLPYRSTNSGLYAENERKLYRLLTCIASLITGFGLVIVYVAISMNIGNVQAIQFIAEMYELVLKLLMTVVNFVGFYCLVNYCTPDSSPKPLTGRENVYLMSLLGLVMLHIGKVIKGNISTSHMSDVLFYTNIISIFQDYLQVVLLLHANRCNKSDPRSALRLFESVLLFTMIINFTLWINDTFLIAQYPITRVLEKGEFSHGVLKLGSSILLPVSVFYRFTSFLEYFSTFKKYSS
ncbi:uncharacterized protein [Argopecten irradians]|uniref:uncharacterized protein n=1 Tax=Argopecten irradians TaxID=31199 RepID=UPI00370F9F65